MKPRRQSLLYTLWLALALAILPALSAQDTPPVPAPPPVPATPDQPAAPAPAEVDEKADKAEKATTPDDSELRELAPGTPSAPETAEPPARSRSTRAYDRRSGSDRPPFGGHHVPEDQRWREAISIFGDTRVDGTVRDAAVSILGSTTVNGTVDGEAVSILGTTTINGKVKGVAVAVFGDMVLGPEAEVGDEVIVVLGRLTRDPGAVTRGGVQEVRGFGPLTGFEWLRAWVTKCVLWGRPLWFGENLGWAWMVAGIFLLFYMLLALLFPRGIERCAEVLEQKPGNTILAALLTALITPILLVLLAITGIGLVLIPFLAAALFFGTLFGKAAVCAWFGRRITGQFGEGPMRHAAIAVFFGGIIIALLYTIPLLGMLLWKLFGILGLGMVVYVLVQSMRRERPAPPAAAPAPAPMPAAAGFTPAPTTGFAEPVAAPAAAIPVPPVYGAAPVSLPGVISAATLPRAGFWIRVAAAFLDFMLIIIPLGMIGAMNHGPGPMFLGVAIYNAVMWKLKGTTIGGIVCGLKLVRVDDRPIDWGVAIVRALAGFLSFFMIGLGFIWVAFDDEKQSWHDKIAGTTIVKVPKGTPLI